MEGLLSRPLRELVHLILWAQEATGKLDEMRRWISLIFAGRAA